MRLLAVLAGVVVSVSLVSCGRGADNPGDVSGPTVPLVGEGGSGVTTQAALPYSPLPLTTTTIGTDGITVLPWHVIKVSDSRVFMVISQDSSCSWPPKYAHVDETATQVTISVMSPAGQGPCGAPGTAMFAYIDLPQPPQGRRVTGAMGTP